MAHVEEYRPGRFRGVARHPLSGARKTATRHPATGEPMSHYECECWAKRVEQDMREGADAFGLGYRVPTARQPRGQGVPTLAEFADVWLGSRARNPRTQSRYALGIRNLAALPVAGKRVDHIRRLDVEAALLGMGDLGWSEHKVADVLNRWRAVMRHAVSHEIIGADPTFGVVAPSSGLSREWTRIDDQGALLLCAGMDSALWPVILLGYDAGLRLGESLGLTANAVNVRERSIRVRAIVAEGEFVRVTKGKAARTVPMTARLADALAGVRPSRESGLLFHDAGRPLPLQRFYRPWHTACAVAGITGARPHDLRHNFCTNLAERGAPFRTIQSLAGHKSDRATMKYVHRVETEDNGRRWIDGGEAA